MLIDAANDDAITMFRQEEKYKQCTDIVGASHGIRSNDILRANDDRHITDGTQKN